MSYFYLAVAAFASFFLPSEAFSSRAMLHRIPLDNHAAVTALREQIDAARHGLPAQPKSKSGPRSKTRDSRAGGEPQGLSFYGRDDNGALLSLQLDGKGKNLDILGHGFDRVPRGEIVIDLNRVGAIRDLIRRHIPSPASSRAVRPASKPSPLQPSVAYRRAGGTAGSTDPQAAKVIVLARPKSPAVRAAQSPAKTPATEEAAVSETYLKLGELTRKKMYTASKAGSSAAQRNKKVEELYQEALKYYDDALSNEFNVPPRESRRGLLHLKKALLHYERLTLLPSYPTNRPFEHILLDVQDFALEAINTRQLQGIDLLTAYELRAKAYLSQKHFSKAVEGYDALFKQTIEKETLSDAEMNTYYGMYVRRARARLKENRLGDNQKALEELEQFPAWQTRVSSFPPPEATERSLRQTRALALVRLKRFDEALDIAADYLEEGGRAQMLYFEDFHVTQDLQPLFHRLMVNRWLAGDTGALKTIQKNYLRTKGGFPEGDIYRILYSGATDVIQTTEGRATLNTQMLAKDRPRFWRRLGENFLEKKEPKKAEIALKEALEHAAPTEQNSIWILLGESYMKQKKYDDVRAALQRVREGTLEPLLEQKRLGLLGDLAFQKQDYVQAANQYENAGLLTDETSVSYAEALKEARKKLKAQNSPGLLQRLQRKHEGYEPVHQHTD